jgi:putative phosphoesterase
VLVGIISDTHDNITAIELAVKFFNGVNVEIVLHCGDICSHHSAEKFSNLKARFIAVVGNNDYEINLNAAIEKFGKIYNPLFSFELGGKKFLMSHRPFKTIEKYDYLLYGHTHISQVSESSNGIFINPGEACGQRYGKKTIALLNTETNEVKILNL